MLSAFACSSTYGAGEDAPFTVDMAGRSQPRSGGAAANAVSPGTASATFTVDVREDGEVLLRIASPRPLYAWSCQGVAVDKATDDGWKALRDDRPSPLEWVAYYLDGEFVTPGGYGCDAPRCEQLGREKDVGKPMEFWQTGEAPPPAGQTKFVDPVAVIEKHRFRGEMRVRFTYSEDPACARSRSAEVSFTVP